MYTSPSKAETTISRKALGVLAMFGICVAAIATFMGTYDTQQQVLGDEAALAHLDALINHHQWLREQDAIIGDLIEEGVENNISITGAIVAIATDKKFVKIGMPIVQGTGRIAKNLIWAKGIVVKTLDQAKIDAAFNDSKTFVAEIKKKFTDNYYVIAKLRQDLKTYQFDLSTIVQDVKLMAFSNELDCDKTIRNLDLRKKILDGGRMSPEKDVKMWNMIIKAQINNLQASIEKCEAIIKKLEQLQKDVKRTSDGLESEISKLRETIDAKNKDLKTRLADLEKKMKSIGCVNNGNELFRAIFTLGFACMFDGPTKKQFINMKAELIEEQAIVQAFNKRMNYFDDLLEATKIEVTSSSGVVESTQNSKTALLEAQNVLLKEFTPEDIAESLGDVDSVNEFAQEFWKVQQDFKSECLKVSDEMQDRWYSISGALTGINKYFKEEAEEVADVM